MQTLILRTFILLFVALAVSAAHSWNTGVVLHLEEQDEFDWAQMDEESAEAPEPEQSTADAGAQPEQTRPVETPSEPEEAAKEQPAAAEGTEQGVEPDRPRASGDPYVTVEQARRLFERQFLPDGTQVIFVDARARAEYEKGHIEGAMSLPAGDFGATIPGKARDWLPGSAIVIYCQGAECTDSHDVARRLQAANLGIARIFIFKEGYPTWVDAGLPTMTGPDVIFGP